MATATALSCVIIWSNIVSFPGVKNTLRAKLHYSSPSPSIGKAVKHALAFRRSTINPAVFLKLIAPIFFMVGALHLIFGVGADVMLGANLSNTAISDPVLDSQNRFYGTAFTLYGAVFYICSQDIAKYLVLLRSALWIFFAAGIARVVSIAIYGLPSVPVLGLLAIELLMAPLYLYWYSRYES